MRVIKRGDVVFDVADPRHHGIVETLHLVRRSSDKRHRFYANIKWLGTGWHTVRVPVADLRLVKDEPVQQTEDSVLRNRLKEQTS